MLSSIKKIFYINTFYGFLKQGFTGIISILLIPFFILKIGDNSYGQYLLIQLFTVHGIFSYADFGITGSIVRYLAKHFSNKDHENFKLIFTSYFYLFTLIGFFCALLIFFNVDFILSTFFKNSDKIHDIEIAILIVGAMLLFNMPSLVIKSYFTSIQNLWIVKIWEILYSIFFALGALYLLNGNFTFSKIFIYDFFLSLILLIIFSFIGYKINKKYFSLSPSLFKWSSIVSSSEFSLYMFINKFIGLIINKGPQLIIGAFFTANYLTYYTIFTKFPFLVKQLMGTLNSAVLPISVFLNEKNKKNEISSFLKYGTMISILFNIPLALFMLIFSNHILEIWVGNDYVFLSNQFSLMMIWAMINTTSSFFVSMYNKIDQLKIILPVSLSSLSIFIFGLALSVINTDLYYVIYGFLCSAIFSSFVNIILLKKTFNISLFSYIKFIIPYYLLSMLIVFLFYKIFIFLEIGISFTSLLLFALTIFIVSFIFIARYKE